MSNKINSPTIFNDGDNVKRQVVLPWNRSLEMCWANVRNRMGRSVLTLVGIIIVVAFFMSSIAYQHILTELMGDTDLHTLAVLERAGVVVHDEASLLKQEHRKIWLLSLSGLLCFVGIVNTMLMSVTERFREIGTLKCLGALDRFVVRLFLVESFFIGLIGALVGTLVGYLLCIIQVASVLELGLVSFSGYLSAFWESAVLVLIGGTLLTVVAAIYPTYVAAKMKPVDAMRVEI